MAISFVFKKQSSVVETPEKYDFPVLTSCVLLAIKGSVARFEMNKALLEALNIDLTKDALVSVGQNEDGQLVLVNTTGMETPYQYHVNKDGSINSKKLYERLVKTWTEFNPNAVNEFKLVGSIEDGMNIATIEEVIIETVVKLEDIPTLMENALTEAEVMEADDDFDAMEAYHAQEEERLEAQSVLGSQDNSELSDMQREFI